MPIPLFFHTMELPFTMPISSEEIENLHPIETRILLYIAKKNYVSFGVHNIVRETDLVLGQVNQGISWLLSKALISEKNRTTKIEFTLTDLGLVWEEQGSPHMRIFTYVAQTPSTFAELARQFSDISQSDIGSVYGFLAKENLVRMDSEKCIHVQNEITEEMPPVLRALEQALRIGKSKDEKMHKHVEEMQEAFSKKRGAAAAPFKKTERQIVNYEISELGKKWIEAVQRVGITGEEINALSIQMLKDGSWKSKKFRAYNITMPPNRVALGREHVYAQFLRQVKDRLVSLGFEEFDGSLVETEFWNSDALFMPQFHAARDIHDVYYVDEPTHARCIPSVYVDAVAAEHERGSASGSRGWNYSFDKNFTKRLILRSQGTVMSAKTLPNAAVPGKYFGILRVFRHDKVDASHLSDFYQTEGIVLGDDVSLQTLLGLLKIFAEQFAHAEEVKYVPGYFPFTEPSVEVHIKHPKIGWIELGGSGIFRPEVTKPLGINVPVAAWGIGVDRMATVQMGITDIRDLFSFDLEHNILRHGARL